MRTPHPTAADYSSVGRSSKHPQKKDHLNVPGQEWRKLSFPPKHKQITCSVYRHCPQEALRACTLVPLCFWSRRKENSLGHPLVTKSFCLLLLNSEYLTSFSHSWVSKWESLSHPAGAGRVSPGQTPLVWCAERCGSVWGKLVLTCPFCPISSGTRIHIPLCLWGCWPSSRCLWCLSWSMGSGRRDTWEVSRAHPPRLLWAENMGLDTLSKAPVWTWSPGGVFSSVSSQDCEATRWGKRVGRQEQHSKTLQGWHGRKWWAEPEERLD